MKKYWLNYENGNWVKNSSKPKTAIERRCVLMQLYQHFVQQLQAERALNEENASSLVRKLWNDTVYRKSSKDLPLILGRDAFLRMYAQASAIEYSLFQRLEDTIYQVSDLHSEYEPLYFGQTDNCENYFDVDATPPGFFPKFIYSLRVKKDITLLEQIQSDLCEVAKIENFEKRTFLTLAILAHGASYREIEGRVLKIASLTNAHSDRLVPYSFRQHLLWEGVKTVSAFPLIDEDKERSIYLCQGTEIWPSQPAMLGSIIANLGKEGSATEPYAHSWRAIHKHLRYLTRPLLPIVAGHSMGGSMSAQIALYSHPLIEKAYAFNPPSAEKRDYEIFKKLPSEVKDKLQVFASIDDLPFWRIGSHVIGNVTCFMGEKRFRYRPMKRWEFLFVFPALFKMLFNMFNALPAHQHIIPLLHTYLYFRLSDREIELENRERNIRFDHIDFFPKLYTPASTFLKMVRKYFRWRLRDTYVRSQLEILELHEQDLMETLAHEGGETIEEQLRKVQKQKNDLLKN